MRPVLKLLPQFAELSSTVIDKLSRIATWLVVEEGKRMWLDEGHFYLFVEGSASVSTGAGRTEQIVIGEELGWRPYTDERAVELNAASDCGLIAIEASAYKEMLRATPELNYQTRKRLMQEGDKRVDWLLGVVDVY